jgi:host factor-I protein
MEIQKAEAKKTKGGKGAKKAGADAARPAQYRFLTELVNDRRTVAIFLINGLKLEGKIASFDDYAILLEGEMSDHVYKHAVSTIQPLTGPVAKAETRAKAVVKRVEPEVVVRDPEHKPRQPTIVVRPKRRIIKRDPE